MYIGIDPDIRKINCAIISDEGKLEAVFLRKNQDKQDPLIMSAFCACRLVEDVIGWVVANRKSNEHITTIIENQNMPSVHVRRQRGQNINYEDIRRLAVVTGQLMGAFSNMSDKMALVDPVQWKGSVPKDISHRRIYSKAGLKYEDDLKSCIYPSERPHIERFSEDKINPGDYADINDSIGLSLYGIKVMKG